MSFTSEQSPHRHTLFTFQTDAQKAINKDLKPLYSGASVLQLNSCGVDARRVEILLDVPGQSHVMINRLCSLGGREHLEVTGGHNPPSDQPPDVELVDAGDARDALHQVGLQLGQVNVGRDGVEEDEGGVPEERPGGHADDDHDEEGEDGVEVVPVLPICQPDDGGADHHHHTAQSVSHHVQEDTADVHLRASSLLLRGLSLLGMAVAAAVTVTSKYFLHLNFPTLSAAYHVLLRHESGRGRHLQRGTFRPD